MDPNPKLHRVETSWYISLYGPTLNCFTTRYIFVERVYYKSDIKSLSQPVKYTR